MITKWTLTTAWTVITAWTVTTGWTVTMGWTVMTEWIVDDGADCESDKLYSYIAKFLLCVIDLQKSVLHFYVVVKKMYICKIC